MIVKIILVLIGVIIGQLTLVYILGLCKAGKDDEIEMSELNIKVSDILNRKRNEKEFTVKYIAENLYVSEQAVYRWLRGDKLPSIDNLCALADLFECSTDELLGREDMRK